MAYFEWEEFSFLCHCLLQALIRSILAECGIYVPPSSRMQNKAISYPDNDVGTYVAFRYPKNGDGRMSHGSMVRGGSVRLIESVSAFVLLVLSVV